MTGYRRFVSYVYEYRKGKKEENCGFVKVESRMGKLQVEVHLKNKGIAPELECKVYGFLRRGGELQGILLGACETGQDKAECILETDADNLHGSGISLKELGGMVFLIDGGGFYGTQWDEEVIVPERFVENRQDEERKPAEPENDGTSAEPEEKPADQKEPVVSEEPAGQKEPAISEDPVGQEESVISEEPAGQEEPVIPEKPAGQEEPAIPEEPAGQEEPAIPEELDGYSELPRPGQFANQEETASGEEDPGQKGLTVPPEVQGAATSSPAPSSREFDPFGDEEIILCRKIRGGDFTFLNRKDWALRNNRFLLHGFYHFGHLLLGKLKSGQYILGVPGMYDQQERFMANMFGFPHFKYSQDIKVPQGKGGYWYRLIYPPNFR